jgi:holo-[acyl-carrier protein] synthase
MVAGVGIDIVEVERIAESIGKGHGFKQMVFSQKEIAYCDKQANSYQHYAARFAAKEAFFKAMGIGWATGTSFNEIEVVNDENGKPIVQLLGETAQYASGLGINKILVSLSHTKTMATAVVIIEK